MFDLKVKQCDESIIELDFLFKNNMLDRREYNDAKDKVYSLKQKCLNEWLKELELSNYHEVI